MVHAFSRAVDAEMAHVTGSDGIPCARAAAEAFESISIPFYAVYFRWREADATLESGNPSAALGLLREAHATARARV